MTRILLLLLVFAVPVRAEEPEPTPVTITADDVYELQAENRQEKLERDIRRDLESISNWSDDNDD